MLPLLATKRFLPFFICQFCGAFNDNLFRLALVTMLSFGVFQSGYSGALIQLSAALFILPFFLFSAAAGELTDALPKRRVLISIKTAELLIMTAATAALALQSLPLLLACLFFAGAQSAFFGPIKYSLLPALLKPKELLDGNAWFSVATYAAILAGTLLGTLGGASPNAAVIIGGGFIALAALGLLSAFFVPANSTQEAPQPSQNGQTPQPTQPPRFAPFAAYRAVFNIVRAQKNIYRCIIAVSWFWLIGAVLLGEIAQTPYQLYLKLLLGVVSGVCAGALACYFLLRGNITTRYAPPALLLSAALLLLLSFLLPQAAALNQPETIALLAVLVLLAAVLTIYVVPLNATIQKSAPPQARGKIIAALNIVNALYIVAATVIAAAIHAIAAHFGSSNGGSAQIVLLLTALFALLGVPLAALLLSVEHLRRLLLPLLRALFRVRLHGEQNLNTHSTLVCNHQSLLDGVLLAFFLQNENRRLGFPIDTEHSKGFIARNVLKLVHSYPLNPLQPHAVRTMLRNIRHAKHTIFPLIFPEGRITTSGGIMKAYPGAGIIAEKMNGGRVTPVIIEGMQYATSSYMQGKFPLRAFPAAALHVFPPALLACPPQLRGDEKRHWYARHINYLMEQSLYQARRPPPHSNLTRRFVAASNRFGSGQLLFSEFLPRRQLTYRQVYTAALALGKKLRAKHAAAAKDGNADGQRIGLLLPSSVGAAVCFYAAVFQRLAPAFLNPSAGKSQTLDSCRAARIRTVYTSQRLLERLPAAADIAAALQAGGVEVVLLEDLRAQITVPQKLAALFGGLFMHRSARALPGYHAAGADCAALLFTSGSEGAPKGVALSHTNLLANGEQVLSRVDMTPSDVVLNALPVFHVFGMLAGIVLPMMAGAQTWHYPSPLHYKIIPEALYSSNATVFFSANSFLNKYGRAAHPYDFHKLRLVFAGAEKLQEETRRLWLEKFGVRILEGYGVTETAPAIAVNSPLFNKTGSVGRVLPGIETRLQPLPDLDEGGRLHVRGDNVMLGYITQESQGEILPPPQGWHDTGDIVTIDGEGYITILGRVKRFIKVAGEMVPLDRIEECLRRRWPEAFIAAVGLADENRGERVALMSTQDITRADISELLKAEGLPELWLPRVIKIVSELPQLPSGKLNYPAITKQLAG